MIDDILESGVEVIAGENGLTRREREILGDVYKRQVHNTGAAWGMFDESTFALGVMSVLVCVALTVYLFTAGKRAGVMETVGIRCV